MTEAEIHSYMLHCDADEFIKGKISNKKEDSIYYRILLLIPNRKDRAVPMSYVSSLTGIDTRQLRATILQMRIHGLVIAGDSYGYYIPISEEEIEEYYHLQRGRALTTLRSLQATKSMLERLKNE